MHGFKTKTDAKACNVSYVNANMNAPFPLSKFIKKKNMHSGEIVFQRFSCLLQMIKPRSFFIIFYSKPTPYK